MNNWLAAAIDERNATLSLPEVDIAPELFKSNHTEMAASLVTQKAMFEDVLKHSSPFMPSTLKLSNETYNLYLEVFNPMPDLNVKTLHIDAENKNIPTGTVRLMESNSLKDSLLLELTSEYSCEYPVGTYIQRVERFNSEGTLLGELRRIRLPKVLIDFPDSLKYLSEEIQIELLMSSGEHSDELGVTIGGYSFQNGDTPLVYYLCEKKDGDSVNVINASYSPDIVDNLEFKDLLKTMLNKYTPELL